MLSEYAKEGICHEQPRERAQRLLQRCSNPSLDVKHPQISSPPAPRSVSSPETAVVEEQSGTPPDDDVSLDSASLPSLTGCKACGREDIERGCNGEGRIQGGIATIPGFGWWPIKAYRPCPAYVASGGRYRRTGQSMDEVVSARKWKHLRHKKEELTGLGRISASSLRRC
ncbi:hypothetical protein PHJA_000074300 [Phtheirospermum japonicum]|uniref:Uncharacterized protein n=1 Tax=Phtheirospermum japonicum TaxID=374723 RepID=A0A830B2Z9_9LAMI|nr:hypothetical protein PHJA_000074300 [Phtheirospermum japonicum]